MRIPGWWNDRVIRACMIAALLVLIGDGLATTFFITRPFWIDEWRVIYNLKTRSIPGLWGELDFLQQYPRLYLSVVKWFTSAFDYSNWALRLPSFIVGTGAIVIGWRLLQRIYPEEESLRYLLVMIVVSSSPFTNYYVQVKQYTMDIALSFVAVWQVVELFRLQIDRRKEPARYGLLCGSMLVAPFFSYTYPIAIAPAFIIVLLMSRKRGTDRQGGRAILQWVPLILSAISITAFYLTDARGLLADTGMKAFWNYKLGDRLGPGDLLVSFYSLFAQVGAGFVFSIIFGIIGIAAFLHAGIRSVANIRRGISGVPDLLRLYSVLLLLLVLLLFLAGKLPLGEPRLNAFMTVSISIQIIDLLRAIRTRHPQRKAALLPGAILYAGVAGNIFTTVIANYTDGAQRQKLMIYQTIGRTIQSAGAQRLPIFVTPGVAFPYEHDRNLPDTTPVTGDWVLQTHPAYHFRDSIPVIPVADLPGAGELLRSMPPGVRRAIVTDGQAVTLLDRR